MSEDNSGSGYVEPEYERDANYIADRITADGSDGWPVAPNRYRLVAARAITYAAARAMDSDEKTAGPLAAMAKLFACDVAVEVTQLGQLLHGGWGYAEEYPISRYVADAQVLPIFEGVKPILALKVIGRSLLGR